MRRRDFFIGAAAAGISTPVLADGFGSGDNTATAAGGNTAMTQASPFARKLTVHDFGAKGDYSTDDTAAIQDALDAAWNAGGGLVFMPTGNYVVSDQLVLGKGVHLVGTGSRSAVLRPSASFPANTAAIRLDRAAETASGMNAMHILLSDFSIYFDQVVSGSIGIYANNFQEDGRIQRMWINGWQDKGIHLEGSGCQNFSLDSLSISGHGPWTETAAQTAGVHLDGIGGRFGITNSTIMGSDTANTGIGIWVAGGTGYVSGIQSEAAEDGIKITSGSVTVVEFDGHTSVTTGVHIASPGGVNTILYAYNPGTNHVVDDNNGLTTGARYIQQSMSVANYFGITFPTTNLYGLDFKPASATSQPRSGIPWITNSNFSAYDISINGGAASGDVYACLHQGRNFIIGGPGNGTYSTSHFVLGNHHFWMDGDGEVRFKSTSPSSATDGVRLAALDYEASTTWDPASIADGAGETKSLTVTGAALGDFVLVAPPYDLQDLQATAYVQAPDTVAIRLTNNTGGAVDLGSGRWKVKVIRQ